MRTMTDWLGVFAILREEAERDRQWNQEYQQVCQLGRIARERKYRELSGSPQWQQWRKVEDLAFDVQNVLLAHRPY